MENVSAINLTKKLVGIESTNPGKYEYNIFKYIKSLLINNKNIKLFENEVIDGRKNLMAVFNKNDKVVLDEPSLIYICHMDTVVIGDNWTKNPFGEEIGERIYGRGSADMKSGLSCMLSAFINICNDKDIIQTKPFKIIFTCDEEGNMQGVEKAIEDKWVNSNDYVLDAEPTDGFIRVAHKGRVWIKLKIDSVTAHASVPYEGVDANFIMAKFITLLKKEIEELEPHDELGFSTVTFGEIKGGYQPYVVPDSCEVTCDFRIVPPIDTNGLIKIIKDIEEKIKSEQIIIYKNKDYDFKGFTTQIEILGDRPYIERHNESSFLKILKKSCDEVTNEDTKIMVFTGYTDTAVIAGKLRNINCMSYGPGSLDMAHKPDEYVDIKDIERCEKVFERVAKNFFEQNM